MFEVGKRYSVHEMSSGEFHSAYDNFYAVIDGKFEEIAMWRDSVMDESMEEDKELTEEQAFDDAVEDVLFHLSMVYEGAKDIAAFRGVPPVAPGKAFDFYSEFECIYVEKPDDN